MFDWNLNHKANQTLAKEGKSLIGKGYLRNDNKRNKPKKEKTTTKTVRITDVADKNEGRQQ